MNESDTPGVVRSNDQLGLPPPACTYADHSYPAYSRAQVIAICDAVVAVERERCAMLCEHHAGMRGTGAWVALTAAADRIRGAEL